jgi:2-polyprenyl-6-methoxyphenol hydroxylase-like FAD-dependent oxidoreductase
MAKAVVIGGGPTGLATAMLLAQRGLDTVVLDRDPLAPDTASAAWDSWERRSVTQFHQVHLLQAEGRSLLQTHLPEVIDEMASAGVPAYNLIEQLARAIPSGPGDVDFGAFETRTTCRRPLLEFGFVNAARRSRGVELRNSTVVTELVSGPSVLDGVPHVIGVKTDTGETISADVVVDAAGRRTPVPGLLESIGARRPVEQAEDVGFVYNTRYYRGPTAPEYLGDALAAVRSISILTMPGDEDYWSVTLYHSPKDKQMRRVRDPKVFDRVVRSLPLQAHWVDGESDDEVISMASTANTTRSYVIDGLPCATGLVPVGDAWGFTNPSVGRGITLGLKHAVGAVSTIAAHLDSPAEMALAWDRATQEQAVPWHQATVEIDRVRGPEVEAFRLGLPDPHDPNDLAVAGARAFGSAIHYDARLLAHYGEIMNCMTLASDVIARPGVFERIIEVASQNPLYETPGPDRRQLEDLLA